MPGYVPARPAAGAIIATDWGQETHDRLYLPKGLVASGSALVLPSATATILDVRNLVSGNAAWLQPDNQTLKCPIGASGWYLAIAFVTVSGVPVGTYLRLTVLRNGGTYAGNSGAYIGIGTYLEATAWIQVNDGDTVSAQGWASAASSSWTVNRLALIRNANAPAST
jgi:hypothetical protein